MTGLVVCAALRIEARALRRGLDPRRRGTVVHVGQRARHAGRIPGFAALAVAGFGGGLDPALRPGDVLVATEIRGHGPAVPCAAAPELAADLAAELEREGVVVGAGPLVTADHIVRGRRERAELAAAGGRAADMESAALAALAAGRPLAAVRVVVDTPDDPLLHPGTLRNGLAARRVLRRVGPALERWGAAFERNEVSP